MAGGTLTAEPSTGGAAFELERFEWTADERIEIEGRWVGVRGRRFVRPTLTLRGADHERRVLALLDHKPWDPGDGAWLAAFAWEGERTSFDEAELAVAPGLEVVLPGPRQGRSRKAAAPARRRPKRYEVRVVPGGAGNGAAAAVPDAAAASPVARRPTRLRDRLADARANVERLEAELEGLRREVAESAGQLEREVALRERIAGERDEAIGARDAAIRHREALEDDLVAARRHLEEALDTREQRDAAARDEREALRAEGEAATRARKALEAERDAAVREREAMKGERDVASQERDAMRGERDAALRDRDSLKLPPSPVSLPRSAIYTSSAGQSLLSLWTPRLIAAGIFATFIAIVVLLFHGSL